MIVLAILGSIAGAVGGQVSLKSGMRRIGRVGRSGELRWRSGWRFLLQGLALYGMSMVLWLFTLSRVELSFAFPFVSLGYVGILLTARFGLGERLDAHRIVGSLLIVAGVILVGLS